MKKLTQTFEEILKSNWWPEEAEFDQDLALKKLIEAVRNYNKKVIYNPYGKCLMKGKHGIDDACDRCRVNLIEQRQEELI